jgi:tRNA modification GTPase
MEPGDTIVALATPQGVGALAVIRVSGSQAIDMAAGVFKGKDLKRVGSHTIHHGLISDDSAEIDEVVVSVYRAPRSFTREDSVEITCHGSPVIAKDILKVFLRRGARLAQPGEFTKRAFLNGRLDLAQAEAVADLILAETENSRQAALNQMRGGFSKELHRLRHELIHFASLVELELDFGEEDVEFARRDELARLVEQLNSYLERLIKSFDSGNVIRNGIATVIAGKPNAGKSTLLNALLNEDRALVSDIPGTTRDTVEDEIELGGLQFRFIDTAGLRETDDIIESMGVQRTREQMKKASLILYLFDLGTSTPEGIAEETSMLDSQGIPYLRIGNKMDTVSPKRVKELEAEEFVCISASSKTNLPVLKERILEKFHVDTVRQGDVLVTNLRHYQSLTEAHDALKRVLSGLQGKVTGDFLAMDIRQALFHLGQITGEITTDDLLENIFSKFCIGK